MNRVGEEGDGRERVARLVPARGADRLRSARRGARRATTAPRRGARTPPRCRRRSSARPGTATGIGAPTSTTARRSARRRTSECRIDSIAQSWACSPAPASPSGAARAMAAVERELIRPEDGLALLFAPPFDKTALDPGYIKGYPPGIRENGGQYTHAALWSVMAFAALGEGDKAAELFSLLNPINHARTRADAAPLQGRALCRRRRHLRRRRRMSGAAAGPGTPARPAGCSARGSRAFSDCACRAMSCISIPAFRIPGRVSDRPSLPHRALRDPSGKPGWYRSRNQSAMVDRTEIIATALATAARR